MATLKTGISVIVISRNEATRIDECFQSLLWVDEKILVDNDSVDETIRIAAKYQPTVIRLKTKNFSELRMAGLQKVTFQWVLYIDADERVTNALRMEILETISSFQEGVSPIAYNIYRKNYYLGHEWPQKDALLRLFRKNSLKEWRGRVHESAQVLGESAFLKEPLVHITHRTINEMVVKTNDWSTTEAELRVTSGHPKIVWWRFLRVMSTAFFNYFFIQGGWRVGTIGWIESIYQTFSIFITYAKLWELQKEDDKRNS